MIQLAGVVTAAVFVLFVGIGAVLLYGRPSGRSPFAGDATTEWFDLHAGVVLIDDGYAEFGIWRTCMLRERGDDVEPHLERYHEYAKSIAETPRSEWYARVEDVFTTDPDLAAISARTGLCPVCDSPLTSDVCEVCGERVEPA